MRVPDFAYIQKYFSSSLPSAHREYLMSGSRMIVTARRNSYNFVNLNYVYNGRYIMLCSIHQTSRQPLPHTPLLAPRREQHSAIFRGKSNLTMFNASNLQLELP